MAVCQWQRVTLLTRRDKEHETTYRLWFFVFSFDRWTTCFGNVLCALLRKG